MNTRKDLAPIVLFVYDRLNHTQQTVEALKQNPLAGESDLFIYSDGPKDESGFTRIQDVREYIKSINGFNNIHIFERDTNWGLFNSIVAGVTEIIDEYNNAIVLEDDIYTSPNFLNYMNDALVLYENDRRVFSVAGYNPPITIHKQYEYDAYFSYRFLCWGWGSWADRWNITDWALNNYDDFRKDRQAQKIFDRGGNDMTRMLKIQKKGKIDSWDITWAYSHFKNNAFCLCPVISKTQNIGCDGTGIHSSKTDKYYVDTHKEVEKNNFNFPKQVIIENEILSRFKRFYDLSPLRKLTYGSRQSIRHIIRKYKGFFIKRPYGGRN